MAEGNAPVTPRVPFESHHAWGADLPVGAIRPRQAWHRAARTGPCSAFRAPRQRRLVIRCPRLTLGSSNFCDQSPGYLFAVHHLLHPTHRLTPAGPDCISSHRSWPDARRSAPAAPAGQHLTGEADLLRPAALLVVAVAEGRQGTVLGRALGKLMTIGFDIHEGSTLTAGLAGSGDEFPAMGRRQQNAGQLECTLFRRFSTGSQHASFCTP